MEKVERVNGGAHLRKKSRKKIKPITAKEIACAAVMTALLIGGQFALSWVAGVEVVTVLLLCFAFVFGPRAGALTAIAFSLLRCFIWGFYPSVIVLYLIYYPLFAIFFGFLGMACGGSDFRFPVWTYAVISAVLCIIAVGAAVCAATDFLKISRLAATMVKTLLWVIFALACALFVLLTALFAAYKGGKLKNARLLVLVMVAAFAAACTVCFTLLDDVITPLFMGWGVFSVTSAAYFYSSFLALAPQTVCTIVTVSTMFLSLVTVFKKVAKI